MVFLAGTLIAAMGNFKAWSIVLGLYALVMILVSFYSMRVLPRTESERTDQSVSGILNTLQDVIRSFFQKPSVWAGIAFITLYRFAEGQASASPGSTEWVNLGNEISLRENYGTDRHSRCSLEVLEGRTVLITLPLPRVVVRPYSRTDF
jgi:hypothetical protein